MSSATPHRSAGAGHEHTRRRPAPDRRRRRRPGRRAGRRRRARCSASSMSSPRARRASSPPAEPARRRRGAAPAARAAPAGARRSSDLRELRARRTTILDHYGWVDRNAGIVRIPIERAMDLLAARAAQGGGDDAHASRRPVSHEAQRRRVTCWQAARARAAWQTWRAAPRASRAPLVARYARAAAAAVGQPAAAQPERCATSASTSTSTSRCRSTSPSATRAGAPVTLGSLLRGKPVVLALVYYQCPMLCTLVLNGLVSALRALSFDAGKDSTSSPSASIRDETPGAGGGEEGDATSPSYRRPGAAAGWHFLTGDAACDRAARRGGRLPLHATTRAQAVRPRHRHHGADADRASSRATSTASSTRRATCGSAWSKRRRTASARRSISSCCSASTTTRAPAGTAPPS